MVDVHIILAAPNEEKIKPLIQSEGIIIGVDRGALIAVEEDLELDVALGDFDSVGSHEKTKIEEQAKNIYKFPENKDDTDAELALLYVLNHLEVDNIYLYNWYGGRADHLHSLLMLVLQERFLPLVSKLSFISENNYLSYYLAGEYSIPKVKGMKYVSFVLLTEVKNLTISDVEYPVQAKNYHSPRALISNEFLRKEAILSFDQGIIGVIQSRDAK